MTDNDVVDKLKKMSQWLWVTENDLERNNLAREAAQEIERLRRELNKKNELARHDSDCLIHVGYGVCSCGVNLRHD